MNELRLRLSARLRRAVGATEPPSRLAGAWALGIAIGLSPLMGVHTVLALALALILRLNKVDVFLGTLIINPWTLSIYFPTAVLLGQRLTGVSVGRVEIPRVPELFDLTVWQAHGEWMRPLLLAWGAGATAMAVAGGGAAFFSIRWLISCRRRARKAAQAP